MTKIESIQSRIIGRMQDVLTNEQLQHLENVLAIEFHGIEVQEECTQLVTSEIHWQKILRTFIASKRIENCSPGTLERYGFAGVYRQCRCVITVCTRKSPACHKVCNFNKIYCPFFRCNINKDNVHKSIIS